MDDHEVVNGFDVDFIGSEGLRAERHLEFVGIPLGIGSASSNGNLRSLTDDVRSGETPPGRMSKLRRSQSKERFDLDPSELQSYILKVEDSRTCKRI
ncbi:hypothetical protein CEXT_647621 [Caerostris extrusa]|uniref:Uncharacterized protein n=1 Tax=Caerostris extrusa TaxID=172846 RepID=A0AAV4P4J5_CAEEX|nr:hypothetical protein CEXT_647621 [Caerostris extrusa]